MRQVYATPIIEVTVLLTETVIATSMTGGFEDFGHTTWKF